MGRRPNCGRARTKRFFVRVLLSGFMKKLLIPRKYAMLHRETLGKECVLWPTHTRDSWHVRTKLIENELYFKKGWGAFSKHHSLQFGDMLIFRHVRDSEFEVDVVDKSATPKETLASKKDQLMKDIAPIPTSRQKKAILESAALTAAEALISSSEYPSFMKIMKAAFVQRSGGYLHVPLDYSKEYMKDYQGNVKIELSDRSNVWTVKAVRRSCETRTILSSGWSDLSRENSLQVDDVCVFQLINTKDYTLKLTIFRRTSGENQKRKKCPVKLKSSYSEFTLKSKELSNKALEEANRFQSTSKYPSVVIVMKRAYVKHAFLHVPFALQKEMCKKMDVNEVKLQSLGEEWKVIMKNVSEQYRIYKGWGTFVKKRSIEVGDVCVLELLNREDYVIRVSIFKCNS
ncbi:hypothetical protein POM88_021095 [Heracleum sosnowskyi]|uniref:TF-B3 domain-containing protein n=1 Tax=Heracleum sosnowskyi TaxID=360622 RepID=A0AAD8ICZ4_9APIA|nr:hypothetical protein POM88_021095 [Heracleum sosnowskyi]